MTPDEQEDYKTELLLIVADELNSAGQYKTLAEQMVIAAAWFNKLHRTVPLDRLADLYEFTSDRHKDTFPVNANEMLARFDEMIAEEKAAAETARREEIKRNKILHCSLRHLHFAEDDGSLEYKVGAEKKWLPCHGCRPQEHKQRSDEIKIKLIENAKNKHLDNMERAKKMIDANPIGLTLVKTEEK